MTEEYALINGLHSMEDLNLTLVKKNILAPEVKENNISIPGSDGTINLLKAISGRTNYKSRKIKIIFAYIDFDDYWDSQYSKFADLFHGEECKIIFTADPNYYYQGVAKITKGERSGRIGEISVEVLADPYKYDICATDERVLWDNFDFVDGIMQELIEIPIGETAKVSIVGKKKKVSPVFVVKNLPEGSTASVKYKEREYALQEGENKFPSLAIEDGENELILTGGSNDTTVTIRYRGGRL